MPAMLGRNARHLPVIFFNKINDARMPAKIWGVTLFIYKIYLREPVLHTHSINIFILFFKYKDDGHAGIVDL